MRYWLTDLSSDDMTDSEVRHRIFFALKRAGVPLSIPAHAVFRNFWEIARSDSFDPPERIRALRAGKSI